MDATHHPVPSIFAAEEEPHESVGDQAVVIEPPDRRLAYRAVMNAIVPFTMKNAHHTAVTLLI